MLKHRLFHVFQRSESLISENRSILTSKIVILLTKLKRTLPDFRGQEKITYLTEITHLTCTHEVLIEQS
jgi:hypothetical protein